MRLLINLSLGFLLLPTLLVADELCVYTQENGVVKQVNSREEVPDSLKDKAQCFLQRKRSDSSAPTRIEKSPNLQKNIIQQSPAKGSLLASPEEIVLKGNLRTLEMSSSIGKISLRWPRSVESLFGRTPERAVADAARTVARVLKTNAFPLEIKSLDINWQVVFMDENIPEAQIPSYLVNNCHPAWMTPPSNIYIVAQRVVAGCGERNQNQNSSGVNDGQLASVLLHEFGHAVEFQILKKFFAADRMRAEGFATWFEMFAAGYSQVVDAKQARTKFFKLATDAIKRSPEKFSFSGSAEDYARAAMYFDYAVSKRGVAGLMSVYQSILAKPNTFVATLASKFSLDPRRLDKEIAKHVGFVE